MWKIMAYLPPSKVQSTRFNENYNSLVSITASLVNFTKQSQMLTD